MGLDMGAFEQAWQFLKADTSQIYNDARTRRQTMHPEITSIVDRENKRLLAELEKKPLSLTNLFSPPPQAEVSLVDQPRNRHFPAEVTMGIRNFPTEGGPDNETKNFRPVDRPKDKFGRPIIDDPETGMPMVIGQDGIPVEFTGDY
jgi:hypothetical protein